MRHTHPDTEHCGRAIGYPNTSVEASPFWLDRGKPCYRCRPLSRGHSSAEVRYHPSCKPLHRFQHLPMFQPAEVHVYPEVSYPELLLHQPDSLDTLRGIAAENLSRIHSLPGSLFQSPP